MGANKDFDKLLQAKLDERKAKGLLRSLVSFDDKIDFCSNDYLGFAKLLQLNQIGYNTLPSGATGSRLITGNSNLAEETEKIIADYHNAESALIFNSGYCANVGLFSSIAHKGDTLIADEFIHASIIDGMRLSHANRYKFKHNNIIDLEKKLQLATGNKIVVIESIYSMDGDEAPLKEMVALCKKNDAILIVDEAHAIGIFGEKGEGLVCQYNLQNDVYACIYTFGKSLGLHGAVVTGSSTLHNYLINYARSFIYTTALPPHTYLQIQEAYKLLPTANRKKLMELINHFNLSIKNIKNISFLESHSAIQTIIVGENNKTTYLADQLIAKGFFIKAILAPTVAIGTERIRICLHTFNTIEQIDSLLNEIGHGLGLINSK